VLGGEFGERRFSEEGRGGWELLFCIDVRLFVVVSLFLGRKRKFSR